MKYSKIGDFLAIPCFSACIVYYILKNKRPIEESFILLFMIIAVLADIIFVVFDI
jgi:hypothetical protein